MLRTSQRVFAWTVLTACSVLLALLLQGLVTSALLEPGNPSTMDGLVLLTPPPDRLAELTRSTAALADGDDARARFLASEACDPTTRVCSDW